MENYVLGAAIKELRTHIKSGDRLLKKFLGDIEQVRKGLGDNKNLLIHDPTKGGVLRGHFNSRTYEKPEPTNALRIACDNRYMVNIPTEVPFSRAVFNLPDRILHVLDGDDEKEVHLIAYEAPLLRKDKADATDGLSDRAVRCDLVGVAGDELWAIEVKTKTGEATGLDYGMLEAYAYGHLLDKHRKSAKFMKEMDLCRRHFHLKLQELPNIQKVRCFVAAPRSYIREYLGKGNKTKENARRRLLEARLVELLIRGSQRTTPEWGGFIMFDQGQEDLISEPVDGNANLVVPLFKEPTGKVILCHNTYQLEEEASKDL